MMVIKRLLFYWTASFVVAALLYFVLRAVMPNNYVFGFLPRMFLYHWEHPLEFIAIPCFFYGIIATYFANKFSRQNIVKNVFLTVVIILLTILVSSPLGGMLWYYYDMKAGFFPENWLERTIKSGFSQGLVFGWLIVSLSIPYNILGAVLCYFITKKGSEWA